MVHRTTIYQVPFSPVRLIWSIFNEVKKDVCKCEHNKKVGRLVHIFHSYNFSVLFNQRSRLENCCRRLEVSSAFFRIHYWWYCFIMIPTIYNSVRVSLVLRSNFVSEFESPWIWRWAIMESSWSAFGRTTMAWSMQQAIPVDAGPSLEAPRIGNIETKHENVDFVVFLMHKKSMQENSSTSRYCTPYMISLNRTYLWTSFRSFRWEVELTIIH